jgi:hypothetical protein
MYSTCSTMFDRVRRCSTVVDGGRRCSTVVDDVRRCSTMVDRVRKRDAKKNNVMAYNTMNSKSLCNMPFKILSISTYDLSFSCFQGDRHANQTRKLIKCTKSLSIYRWFTGLQLYEDNHEPSRLDLGCRSNLISCMFIKCFYIGMCLSINQ